MNIDRVFVRVVAALALAVIPHLAVAQEAAETAQKEVATAVPVAEAVAEPVADQQPTLAGKAPTISATIHLANGDDLMGALLDAVDVPMKTSFGQVNIPLSEIAGIKMARDGQTMTTVVLHNGDAVSGAIDLNRVMLETEWGKAEINSQSISTILFSQGFRWMSENGIAGTRWKLVEVAPEKEETKSVKKTESTSSTASSSTPSTSNSTTTRRVLRTPSGARYYPTR